MSDALSHQQLLQIAHTYQTPLYVYNANIITRQYQRLQKAFSTSEARFFYASKALTNINVLKHIKNIGCNIDCSSYNEVQMALLAGFATDQILYTSNSIHFSEVVAAVEAGVHINIDSLSNLKKFGERYGHNYPVGVRLRPNIMAGGNLKISTGHSKSKFGIPVEDLPELLRIVKENNIHLNALHIHTGSEIKDVDIFMKGVQVLFDLAVHFPELAIIDLGGGFKVPYKTGEEGTDIPLLGQKITEAFEAYNQQHNKKLVPWFEPGKFLVSEAGSFLVKVNVLKQSGDILFAGVDSGLNHLIRPMFYGSYHHIENISNPESVKKQYQVVGNICETDNFAEDRSIAEIREEDILVMHNAGAYGFEMASNYNARFKPAEVLVKDGVPELIRKRDELEDLLKNQIY